MEDSTRSFCQTPWDGFIEYVKLYDTLKHKHSAKQKVFLRYWTPFRFCVQDHILCVHVARVIKKRYEIALFSSADHYLYAPGVGAMGGLIFSLSYAYYATGSMELFFIGPKNRIDAGTKYGFESIIPRDIRRVASIVGVTLSKESMITDAEGRELYILITGLSESLITELNKYKIDLAHAAFMVNRGVWSVEAVELITFFGFNPKVIFNGGHHVLQRLSFKRNMILLSTAIMADRFKTKLLLELGDRPGSVTCSWHSAFIQKLQIAGTTLDISAWPDGQVIHFVPEQERQIIFLCRNTKGYASSIASDLELLASQTRNCIVVFTKDVDWLGQDIKDWMLNFTQHNGISCFSIVDTLDEIEQEVLKKARPIGKYKTTTGGKTRMIEMQISLIQIPLSTWNSWPLDRSLNELYKDALGMERRITKNVNTAIEKSRYVQMCNHIETIAQQLKSLKNVTCVTFGPAESQNYLRLTEKLQQCSKQVWKQNRKVTLLDRADTIYISKHNWFMKFCRFLLLMFGLTNRPMSFDAQARSKRTVMGKSFFADHDEIRELAVFYERLSYLGSKALTVEIEELADDSLRYLLKQKAKLFKYALKTNSAIVEVISF